MFFNQAGKPLARSDDLNFLILFSNGDFEEFVRAETRDWRE